MAPSLPGGRWCIWQVDRRDDEGLLRDDSRDSALTIVQIDTKVLAVHADNQCERAEAPARSL